MSAAVVTVFFTCLDCDLVGQADRTAEKHTRATGHTTVTGTDPEGLVRMWEQITGKAALAPDVTA